MAIGPSLLWRAGNIRTPGTVAKVNLVLSGLPRFTAAGGDDRLVRGRILVAPGIDALERAHDAAKFGRLPDNPVMEATIPSLADPSLVEGAPSGTHVMSVIVQGDAVRPARRVVGDATRAASATLSSGRSTSTRPGSRRPSWRGRS